MGFFDIFKRRKNGITIKEKDQMFEETPDNMQKGDISTPVQDALTSNELIDENIQVDSGDNYEITNGINSYSDIISDEIIEEIKRVNNMIYIDELLIKRMEKNPELIDLLLKGNISQRILSLLNDYEKLSFLPDNEEELIFIKYFDLDEKTKKLVSLLNNRINDNSINETYISCFVDLKNEFKTINFHNELESLIPGININLGSELLTKIPSYSSFIMHFSKSKKNIVSHSFEKFVTGEIELNDDIIIQMSYDTFKWLDESIVDKISKCKIIISDSNLNYSETQSENDIDYSLVKYNHLIYIIENSSLNDEIKEKLIYKIKNAYSNKLLFDFELLDEIHPYLDKLSIEEIKKLTKEFELNIEEYKDKKIEPPEVNAIFYINENFQDFDSISIEELVWFINSLAEKMKLIILQEPRVLQKLNISDKLDEKQLKKLLYLLAQSLSSTTMDFINSLDFDIEKFLTDPSNKYNRSFDINPIISKYGVFDYLDQQDVISVADILGHDGCINCGGYKGSNILYTFENFFKKNGDGYHTRALGLLEYKTGEQLIKELNKTNDTMDMKLMEIEDGKYIISTNGLHRFTVLRFHYLLDRMKKEKTEEELRELYKIPVTITSRTNYKKTYCNYLIKIANQDISTILFDFQKDIITICYASDEKKQIINEESLLKLAVQSVDMLDSNSLLEIQHFYDSIDSFHNFIDMYVPNLLDMMAAMNKEAIK